MAQNTTLSIPAATWTLITDSDITSITFQNLGGVDMLVKATTDTVAPTNSLGALHYPAKYGEMNAPIADLFPGLALRDRLWVYADTAITVQVSHA